MQRRVSKRRTKKGGEAVMISEAMRQAAEGKINANNGQITRDRAALESLGRFRTDVESAREAFRGVNSGKSNLLSQLDAIKERNKIAARYQSGMTESLSGIGIGIVGMAFGGLIASITLKEKAYKANIGRLEAENTLLSVPASEGE